WRRSSGGSNQHPASLNVKTARSRRPINHFVGAQCEVSRAALLVPPRPRTAPRISALPRAVSGRRSWRASPSVEPRRATDWDQDEKSLGPARQKLSAGAEHSCWVHPQSPLKRGFVCAKAASTNDAQQLLVACNRP